MPDSVTVSGRMVGGAMKLSGRAYLVEVTGQWPEGCDFTMKITRERARLSELQRGYWFAVVVPMVAEETGDDEDSTHEDLKRVLVRYFPQVTKRWRNRKTGQRRQLTKRLSIADLNAKQMTDLIDGARLWAGEFLHVEIPAPDPAWRSKAGRAA